MYLGTCQLILQHIMLWPFEKLASDWSWENDTSQRTWGGHEVGLFICYITKIDISSKYLRWMLKKLHISICYHMLSLQTFVNK